MALEAIKAIKVAEEEAEKIINKAQIESNEIIKNAKTKATEKYREIISKANDEKNNVINEEINLGKCDAKYIKKEGEQEVDTILNTSRDKINKAMNLIVERIVNKYGNS